MVKKLAPWLASLVVIAALAASGCHAAAKTRRPSYDAGSSRAPPASGASCH